ncbi:D12 class N6 adenine-specific DNA methyltransferase [Pseudodesulfovibrio profundus]|uniref:D12 class N6 adenine-specific DNA methyltransferase n=1 Tax=Pseudodesulfovibrio profundus TaxID=57320 RepID=A0A2C8FDR1_9BACT|nr:DNA adenine methylase [Pseudodesulfovibrio profundus]SOB60601.1 D12 class N6 adenine-specific DNA methyltransferase [Pseudodesulfovibrio profundus]
MKKTRPVLRYHGGKWKLAPWIIKHLPPHKVYVEPYGGAASVLLQKPRVYAEVYNDLGDEVVNVFQVMREPLQMEELKKQLTLTPFSEVEFFGAYEAAEDPIEKARRTIVRSFMGFGSASSNAKYTTGFRGKSFRSGTSPANDWRNYPNALDWFCERLQGVTIRNKPALDLIPTLDREDVLFYVDPPYVRSTRCKDSNGDVYAHEMDDAQHEDLAAALHDLKGKVVLSGYRCDLYEDLYGDWKSLDKDWFADGARERVETLWFNPAAANKDLHLLGMASDLAEAVN